MRFALTTVLGISLSTVGTAFQHPQGCPKLAPAPVAPEKLPSIFTARPDVDVQALLDTEAIRRTLALYALAIDGRSYDSLSHIFAQDVVANYSAPLGVLTGLDAIKTSLEASLTVFDRTQHLLGSQIIEICGPRNDAAVSVTYYQATHFLPRNATGGAMDVADDSSVMDAWGQYQDTWRKARGGWRIVSRNLVYMVSLQVWVAVCGSSRC